METPWQDVKDAVESWKESGWPRWRMRRPLPAHQRSAESRPNLAAHAHRLRLPVADVWVGFGQTMAIFRLCPTPLRTFA